jgi:hypothetical protein
MKAWRSGRVADCNPVGCRFAPAPPHAAFDTFLLCRTSSTFANNKFDMDVEKFVRLLCRLVLRHQMPVWNYFVNSFYSVAPFEFCGRIFSKWPPIRKSPIPLFYTPSSILFIYQCTNPLMSFALVILFGVVK